VETYVVRVWVPDRPGALGQVASRIGAVRGDVIGIDILERGGGRAIDELVVRLPSADVVDLLVSEIAQVDDAAVEEVRRIEGERPELPVVALEIAARLVESPAALRLDALCRELVGYVDGDWALAVALDDGRALVEVGEHPTPAWLAAFIEGSRHLPPEEQTAATPHDLAWAHLPSMGAAVAIGRHTTAFRARERRQVALLGRIVDGLGC
jgi:hypothetical protein